jgi:cytoskeletal protein RodZ
MKSIGEFLKEGRHREKRSLAWLEEKTKIKKEFLQALEDEKWANLPGFTVVTGFVKSVTSALDLDEKRAVAILKRDYPPKKVEVNPQPDVADKFTWNPKLTFVVGIGIVLVVVLGYLVFQYVKFVSPPKLTVDEPKQGQEVTLGEVRVAGKTSPGATLTINNQPALVDEKGDFETEIEVVENTSEIVVVAKSRSSRETKINRQIVVKSD